MSCFFVTFSLSVTTSTVAVTRTTSRIGCTSVSNSHETHAIISSCDALCVMGTGSARISGHSSRYRVFFGFQKGRHSFSMQLQNDPDSYARASSSNDFLALVLTKPTADVTQEDFHNHCKPFTVLPDFWKGYALRLSLTKSDFWKFDFNSEGALALNFTPHLNMAPQRAKRCYVCQSKNHLASSHTRRTPLNRNAVIETVNGLTSALNKAFDHRDQDMFNTLTLKLPDVLALRSRSCMMKKPRPMSCNSTRTLFRKISQSTRGPATFHQRQCRNFPSQVLTLLHNKAMAMASDGVALSR